MSMNKKVVYVNEMESVVNIIRGFKWKKPFAEEMAGEIKLRDDQKKFANLLKHLNSTGKRVDKTIQDHIFKALIKKHQDDSNNDLVQIAFLLGPEIIVREILPRYKQYVTENECNFSLHSFLGELYGRDENMLTEVMEKIIDDKGTFENFRDDLIALEDIFLKFVFSGLTNRVKNLHANTSSGFIGENHENSLVIDRLSWLLFMVGKDLSGAVINFLEDVGLKENMTSSHYRSILFEALSLAFIKTVQRYEAHDLKKQGLKNIAAMIAKLPERHIPDILSRMKTPILHTPGTDKWEKNDLAYIFKDVMEEAEGNAGDAGMAMYFDAFDRQTALQMLTEKAMIRERRGNISIAKRILNSDDEKISYVLGEILFERVGDIGFVPEYGALVDKLLDMATFTGIASMANQYFESHGLRDRDERKHIVEVLYRVGKREKPKDVFEEMGGVLLKLEPEYAYALISVIRNDIIPDLLHSMINNKSVGHPLLSRKQYEAVIRNIFISGMNEMKASKSDIINIIGIYQELSEPDREKINPLLKKELFFPWMALRNIPMGE